MIIKVRVVPNSKEEGIEEREGIYRIKVKEKAIRGRANAAMMALLAEKFGVKRSMISIIKGQKSREKVVEILNYYVNSSDPAARAAWSE